jgi:hypothetical protein
VHGFQRREPFRKEVSFSRHQTIDQSWLSRETLVLWPSTCSRAMSASIANKHKGRRKKKIRCGGVDGGRDLLPTTIAARRIMHGGYILIQLPPFQAAALVGGRRCVRFCGFERERRLVAYGSRQCVTSFRRTV